MREPSNPVVVFRTDATVTIGSGHVARCLTLAQALFERGAEPVFLCNRDALRVVPALASSPFRTLTIEDGEPVDLVRSVAPAGADLVLFDHYGVAADKETPFRAAAFSLAAIDDLADRRHDVDILFDSMAQASPEAYAGLVPVHCELHCGPPWLLLRQTFLELRPAALERRRQPAAIERLFVCVGGTDTHSLTPAVLRAVEESGVTSVVDVVLGSISPSIEAVQRHVEGSNLDMRLHVDARNVAELMLEADFAIGGGGTMTWERCSLGLPSIALLLADNQMGMTSLFGPDGAGRSIDVRQGVEIAALAELYRAIASDRDGRVAMAAAAARMCDARGAERTADLLMRHIGSCRAGRDDLA